MTSFVHEDECFEEAALRLAEETEAFVSSDGQETFQQLLKVLEVMQPPRLCTSARCHAAEHQHSLDECGYYSSSSEEALSDTLSGVSPLHYEDVERHVEEELTKEREAVAKQKARENEHEERNAAVAADYLEALGPHDFGSPKLKLPLIVEANRNHREVHITKVMDQIEEKTAPEKSAPARQLNFSQPMPTPPAQLMPTPPLIASLPVMLYAAPTGNEAFAAERRVWNHMAACNHSCCRPCGQPHTTHPTLRDLLRAPIEIPKTPKTPETPQNSPQRKKMPPSDECFHGANCQCKALMMHDNGLS